MAKKVGQQAPTYLPWLYRARIQADKAPHGGEYRSISAGSQAKHFCQLMRVSYLNFAKKKFTDVSPDQARTENSGRKAGNFYIYIKKHDAPPPPCWHLQSGQVIVEPEGGIDTSSGSGLNNVVAARRLPTGSDKSKPFLNRKQKSLGRQPNPAQTAQASPASHL